ncbi:MAG: hypothetical protein KBT06_05030 [Prevotellaceae bacterium]|nr:hypothetical protein [Candidatus Colivivens equi]
MKNYLLIFLMSVVLCAQADDNVLHKIEESDSASIFASSNYLRKNAQKHAVPKIDKNDEVYIYEGRERGKNRLVDSKRILMESTDIDLFNAALQNAKTKVDYPGFSDDIYIDVRSQGESKRAFMVSKNKMYVHRPGVLLSTEKVKLKREAKRQVRALYDKYMTLLQEQEQNYARYDTLPMVSKVRTILGFYIGTRPPIVEFYTVMDSSKIVPIDYSVHFKKKSGKILVHRNVMESLSIECAGIAPEGGILLRDKDGNLLILKSKDGEDYIMERLLKMFPEWNDITDQERMRLLDRYLER